MEIPVNYGIYDITCVEIWKNKALERVFRDIEFYSKIKKYFNNGSVLELGSAVGNIAKILEDLGFEVVASDYFDFFVDYERKIGLNAYKVDATEIYNYLSKKFDNVLAQGLSPIMRRDKEMVKKTYLSIHNALKEHGRLIMIQTAYIHKPSKRKTYLSKDEQLEIVREMNIFKVVKVIKHQFVHHKFYSYFNKGFLSFLDFTLAKILPFRHAIILEKLPNS